MNTNTEESCVIKGRKGGRRVESRLLEEQIQEAVANGHRHIEVKAFGQHGIGGRLWKSGNEPVRVRIDGQPGQRVGSMGFLFAPETDIRLIIIAAE